MPVNFKGVSEYNRTYKWIEGTQVRDSAEDDVAGLRSTEIGIPMEPPIQRRKKPISPVKSFEGPAPTAIDPNGEGDYFLLGQQDKFSNNIKYTAVAGHKRGRKGANIISQSASAPVLSRLRHNEEEKARNFSKYKTMQMNPAEPPKQSAPYVYEDKENFREIEQHRSPAKEHKERHRHDSHERHRHDSHERHRHESHEHKHKDHHHHHHHHHEKKHATVQTEKDNRMNQRVQTNMEKGVAHASREAPANYAMQYQAGIAKKMKDIKRVSEYQKQFDWKKSQMQSPLVAAEQLVHRSDPALNPPKTGPPKHSEYQLQYKKHDIEASPKKASSSPPKAPRKTAMKKSKSEENLREVRIQESKADRDAIRKVAGSSNPQKPFFPHGKPKRYMSEYLRNFKAPSAFSYEDGAWKGAPHPHLETEENGFVAEAKPTWYQEVIELRSKADEYRKRSQGTHFSRIHIAQLLAENAELWDNCTESSRTVTSMNLDVPQKIEQRQARKEPSRAAPYKPSPLSAWQENQNEADERVYQNVNRDDVASLISESTARSQLSAITGSEYTLDEDDEGRVPTPRLKQIQSNVVRRHHLDVTTPSVGGALLTSPPPKPFISRQTPSPTRLQVEKKTSSQRKSTEGFGKTKVIAPQAPASEDDYCSLCSCGAEREEVDLKKTRLIAGQSPIRRTFGKPTPDTHVLNDDDTERDTALETEYVRTPAMRKPGVRRHFDVPKTIKESFSETYARPAKRQSELQIDLDNMDSPALEHDDDVLSTSIRSIASSCSLASETLDRARNRRNDFWGNKGVSVK